MLIHVTLEANGILGSNFEYICVSKLSNNWYERQLFVIDEALLSISPATCSHSQSVKMRITLDPHGTYNSCSSCPNCSRLSADNH